MSQEAIFFGKEKVFKGPRASAIWGRIKVCANRRGFSENRQSVGRTRKCYSLMRKKGALVNEALLLGGEKEPHGIEVFKKPWGRKIPSSTYCIRKGALRENISPPKKEIRGEGSPTQGWAPKKAPPPIFVGQKTSLKTGETLSLPGGGGLS